MFKPHWGTCTKCPEGNRRLIVVKAGLCARHNQERKGKPVARLKQRRKPTGERELFARIWKERPHICTNCKAPLGNEARSFFFAHLKGKGAHPELRLEPSNIALMCFDCHRAYDQGTKEQFNNRTKA